MTDVTPSDETSRPPSWVSDLDTPVPTGFRPGRDRVGEVVTPEGTGPSSAVLDYVPLRPPGPCGARNSASQRPSDTLSVRPGEPSPSGGRVSRLSTPLGPGVLRPDTGSRERSVPGPRPRQGLRSRPRESSRRGPRDPRPPGSSGQVLGVFLGHITTPVSPFYRVDQTH